MTTATATTSPIIAAAVNLGELTVANTTWTDDQWADYINAPEANPVLAIIERGKRLGELRATCDQRGDRSNTFQRVLKKVNISDSQARRLITISTRFESVHTVNALPASWGTLYELTRLTETEFNNAIQSGAIHPEMTRAEAEALRSNRPALPASSNQAPQAQDKKDNGSKGATLPPVSPPPAEPEEGEDDDAPFDLGPSVFVDSATAVDAGEETRQADERAWQQRGDTARKGVDELRS